MPKESFYSPVIVEGGTANMAQGDAFTVSWGVEHPDVFIAGVQVDRSAINRLIRVLRKARDQVHGADA